MAIFLSLGACTQLNSFETKEVTESFPLITLQASVVQTSPVDILFVIDNSGSMEPHQTILANNLATWINNELVNFQDLCFSVISFNGYNQPIEGPGITPNVPVVPANQRFCTLDEEGLPKSSAQIISEAFSTVYINAYLPEDASPELFPQSALSAWMHHEFDHFSSQSILDFLNFFSYNFIYADTPDPIFRFTGETPGEEAIIFITDESPQHATSPLAQMTNEEVITDFNSYFSHYNSENDYLLAGIYNIAGDIDHPEGFDELLEMAPSSVAFNIFSGSYANFLEAVADEFNPPVVAYVLNTQFPTSSVQLIEIVLQDGTIIDVPETVYNFSSDGCAIHFEVDYIDGIVAQYSQNASVLVTYFPDSVGEGSCS